MKRPILITIFCLLILGSVSVCVYALIPKHVTNIKPEDVGYIEVASGCVGFDTVTDRGQIKKIIDHFNSSRINLTEVPYVLTSGGGTTVWIYKNDGYLYKKLAFWGSKVLVDNKKFCETYDPAVDIVLIRSYACPPKPAQQS